MPQTDRSTARLLPLLVALAACSGSDATAPIAPPAPTSATSLALGARFGCAITTDAGTFCWGDNTVGQIGDSTRTRRSSPAPTKGAHDYAAIAAADRTACAIDRAGIAWCWGEDATQPGVSGAAADVARRIVTPSPLVAITVGRKFACGLSAGGQAFCWGENNRGQLGVGDTAKREGVTVVPGAQRFTAISAGFWHVCALEASGAAYCWGDNQYAELAPSALGTNFVPTPRKISGNATFKSIVSGSVHTCALTTNGQAYCWGSNFGGQLGDGTADFRLSPTPVLGDLTFTVLRATRANSVFSHNCGVTTSGDVWCWGWNSKGQLGTAAGTDACISPTTGAISEVCSYKAVKVAGISNVATLDVGVEHTCALTKGGRLYCWGDNTNGQLGDGSLLSSVMPVAVLGGLKLP